MGEVGEELKSASQPLGSLVDEAVRSGYIGVPRTTSSAVDASVSNTSAPGRERIAALASTPVGS